MLLLSFFLYKFVTLILCCCIYTFYQYATYEAFNGQHNIYNTGTYIFDHLNLTCFNCLILIPYNKLLVLGLDLWCLTALLTIFQFNSKWQSVLLVEETRVPRKNLHPVTSHRQTLSHNVVSSTPRHERINLACFYLFYTDTIQ